MEVLVSVSHISTLGLTFLYVCTGVSNTMIAEVHLNSLWASPPISKILSQGNRCFEYWKRLCFCTFVMERWVNNFVGGAVVFRVH